MLKFLTLSLSLILVIAGVSFTQAQVISQPQVVKAIHHDTSIPLRDMKEVSLPPKTWNDIIIPLRQGPPPDKLPYEKDTVLQLTNGVGGGGTIIDNFDGVGAQGSAPPDPSGDVGPNHYMQMVNTRFQIWDKNGISLLGPLSLGTIWAGFPGPWASSLNNGDPVVLYDQVADRWFASEFSLPNGGNGPEYILVAISQTGDPTGAWYRYGFEFADFPDYPHYGVWPDGYYASGNRFGNTVGIYAIVFERDKMLIGEQAQMVFFSSTTETNWSLLPSDWDGTTPPPMGAPNYFMQAHDNASYGGTDGLDIFEFHVDWVSPGNSSFSGPVFIPTSPFGRISGIPQQSPGETLDDISDRLMQRLQYRNFNTHQSMVVCQTIDAGGSRAGVRWYELRNTGSGWSLYQEGTYAPLDDSERWMGSIAMNAEGDIALGYSVSSSSMFPEIRYTGRHDGDPLGVMTVTEGTIYVSGGVQTGTSGRWGDYSQMTVDSDGTTFWYTNEYIPNTGSFNWRTRIASFTFGPPCPIGVASNPSPVDRVINVSINLPEINWTNGEGINQVELWFGETGNVSMVYDGSPVNSWSIPETMEYNTNYTWKVIGKNDTCDIGGPTWTFSTEHNPVNQTLFSDNFDSYTAGQQLACQNPTDWTTWNFSPCDVNTDPFVSTDFAFSATNSVKIAPNKDLVHEMGNLTNGKYSMSFKMYIPSGSTGYWNTLQEFAGNSSTFGMQVYYNTGGFGSIDAGTFGAASFRYAYDTWISNEIIVDIDADWAQLFIAGVLRYEWQWSLGLNGAGINKLGANDFYADASMMYYFDDYIVTDLTIIPVELTSFTANDYHGQVTLSWSTATELNNQVFEIQRRTSESQYVTIGYVDGYGTTTKPHEYTYVDNSSLAGTFFYRLKQIDFGGQYQYSEELLIDVTGPLDFVLQQNYPNPFNPGTLIKYSIPENGFVTLDVYNLLGEKVASLVNSVQEAGRYEINFDASELASGIYVYSLKSGSFNSSKKMLLMK